MADYPAAVTSLTNPTSTSKTNSPSHATQHINANDEIEAIQTELGVDPAGSDADVVTRLDAMDTNRAAELGSLHFNLIAAGAGTQVVYFNAPYACTISANVVMTVSSGTGRVVSIAHGSAGDNALATAVTGATGTVALTVAMAASADVTCTASEIMKVTCATCATAQVYGVTMKMTNPT
jgi:hypothetical protein